ncbi:MAG TPA: vitamin K epoxide reductase family protein [Chthoniobacterales bacterium]|nr:vitamin K epoxide reductase family protein [Chthoniobacterales bacterium]
MKPAELSRELRHGTGDFLEERRGIVISSLTAIGCMGLIGLYQIGVIKHVPEPKLPGLDADKVDASDEAYGHFQVGDAFIGLGSYATTMGLAAMGPKDRAKTQPWIPLALAVKATADAAQAAKLTYDQFAKHKAACSWCLIAAAATFVTAALVIPEARAAAEQLRKQL